jgi:adenylylsulfate kinase
MRTGIYVGRFQPFHDGHRKCVLHILAECDRCEILLRDTPKTEKNPFSLERRMKLIRENFTDEENKRIDIVPVPDPGAELAVYIGRGVGYDLIQLDEATEAISATDIRKKLYEKYGKDYDADAPKHVK